MSNPLPSSPTFSSGLSDAETERLALLMDECAEVVQACAKILRHGFESYNPLIGPCPTNREELEKEIGHVHHAVSRLAGAGDIDDTEVARAEMDKAASIGRWLHHQGGAK